MIQVQVSRKEWCFRLDQKVWYLVTNERVVTAEQAWEIVFTRAQTLAD
jgi:hypothetical protein